MYRVYAVVNGRRLTSAPCQSPEVADSFLVAVLALPGSEGGAVEEFRDGLGWFAFIPEADRQLAECC